MPSPHHSIFTGRMLFLTPNHQCQSTEGSILTSLQNKSVIYTLTTNKFLNVKTSSQHASRHEGTRLGHPLSLEQEQSINQSNQTYTVPQVTRELVLTLHSQRKGSKTPSVRSLVVVESRMRAGHQLRSVLCVSFSILMLFVGRQ